MDEQTGMPMIIEQFKALYDKKKNLKAELEETQKELDHWEEVLLEKFNEEGVENIRTTLGTFYTREDFFASYDRTREGEVFEWLEGEDQGDLIKETINAKTLAAWAKEQIEQGVELPDFFNTTTKRRIGVRSK